MDCIVIISILVGLVLIQSISIFIISKKAAAGAKLAVADAKLAVDSSKKSREELSIKIEQIYILVSSNLSKVKAELETAKNTIYTLKLLIEKLSGKNIDFNTTPLLEFKEAKKTKKIRSKSK